MPDIGFLELLLVGIIAFLVLGPDRMPELFGQVGRVVKKGRVWIADVRRKIDEETQLESALSEAKDSLNADDISDWNRKILEQEQRATSSTEPDKTDAGKTSS